MKRSIIHSNKVYRLQAHSTELPQQPDDRNFIDDAEYLCLTFYAVDSTCLNILYKAESGEIVVEHPEFKISAITSPRHTVRIKRIVPMSGPQWK